MSCAYIRIIWLNALTHFRLARSRARYWRTLRFTSDFFLLWFNIYGIRSEWNEGPATEEEKTKHINETERKEIENAPFVIFSCVEVKKWCTFSCSDFGFFLVPFINIIRTEIGFLFIHFSLSSTWVDLLLVAVPSFLVSVCERVFLFSSRENRTHRLFSVTRFAHSRNAPYSSFTM